MLSLHVAVLPPVETTTKRVSAITSRRGPGVGLPEGLFANEDIGHAFAPSTSASVSTKSTPTPTCVQVPCRSPYNRLGICFHRWRPFQQVQLLGIDHLVGIAPSHVDSTPRPRRSCRVGARRPEFSPAIFCSWFRSGLELLFPRRPGLRDFPEHLLSGTSAVRRRRIPRRPSVRPAAVGLDHPQAVDIGRQAFALARWPDTHNPSTSTKSVDAWHAHPL